MNYLQDKHYPAAMGNIESLDRTMFDCKVYIHSFFFSSLFPSDYKLGLPGMDNCFSLMDKKNLPNAQKALGSFCLFFINL
jgi:hypothetical protein